MRISLSLERLVACHKELCCIEVVVGIMVYVLQLPWPCLSGKVEGNNLCVYGSEFPFAAAADRIIMKMNTTGV